MSVANIQSLADSFDDALRVGISVKPGAGASYFNDMSGASAACCMDPAPTNDGGFGSGPGGMA